MFVTMQVQKIVMKDMGKDHDFSVKEAYKSLLTNIQFCGSEVQLITVTSCLPNEGKTTVSFEIAKSLASTGKKVLFIDADMRNSKVVRKYTDAKGIKGLSQLLSGQIALSDALYSTQYSNFYVIFAGQYPPNSVELLNSAKFESLLKSAKEIFDFVIIDAPPLGLVIDAAIIANRTDGAILVCSAGKISRRLANNVLKQLRKSGCRIIGAVLNNVPFRKKNYGYGYGLGKYGYGKYGYGRYGYDGHSQDK